MESFQWHLKKCHLCNRNSFSRQSAWTQHIRWLTSFMTFIFVICTIPSRPIIWNRPIYVHTTGNISLHACAWGRRMIHTWEDFMVVVSSRRDFWQRYVMAANSSPIKYQQKFHVINCRSQQEIFRKSFINFPGTKEIYRHCKWSPVHSACSRYYIIFLQRINFIRLLYGLRY